jgi:hypothetical protein
MAATVIKSGMTNSELLMVMSEGNIGAVTALTMLVQQSPAHAYLNFVALDELGIRGSNLWIFCKHVCGEVQPMRRLIRAWELQVEGATEEAFNKAIGDYKCGGNHSLNVAAIVSAVDAAEQSVPIS